MANADEMFEELGYTKTEETPFDDWIIYSQGFLSAEVTFDTMFKNVYVNSTINAKLHMAIGQKMKELGWLKDE